MSIERKDAIFKKAELFITENTEISSN